MTTEEKAKAYDEALEKAKKIKDNPFAGYDGTDLISSLFLELKESENEKIKKRIIQALHGDVLEMDEIKEAEIWLEKQGEQNPNPCDGCINRKGCINCENGELRETEQNPADEVEPKFKVGDKIVGTISGIPYYITEVCDGHYATDTGCIIMFCAQDNFDIYEQNSAWSEEDDTMLNEIIASVNGFDATSGTTTMNFGKHEAKINWLKTLRPQSQWKPTKKQIMALRWVLNHIPYDIHKEEISGLFDQIKEL